MTRRQSRIKGIISDNDDTAQKLNPSLGYGSPEDQYFAAFIAIALCFGKTFAKDSPLRLKVMGIDIKDVGRIMIEELGLPITYEQWKHALDQILIALAPFAEFEPDFERMATVMKSRGYKFGIASSSVQAVLDAKWIRFPGLRAQMDCFVAGDRVVKSKPEPDLLYAAAREMNLEPEQCVYIGDSRSDMLAAMNAGMQAIFFRHPGRNVAGIPPGVCSIESYAELEEIFR